MVPMDALSAFAEILDNLPRQHLRTRFRNRFGTELSDFGLTTFAKGAARVELDKRIGHLLQEEPPKLNAYRVSGPADDLQGAGFSPSAGDSLAALFNGEDEQAVVIHGITARLYVYRAAGDPTAWVRRIAVDRPERPNAKPPAPTLSRRERAARAGKQKHVKKPVQRRRRNG